jgi:hypothetical protein
MMRKIILLAAMCMAMGNQHSSGQVTPQITSWLQNTTGTGYGGYVSNVQLVQYSATKVYVSANCIPQYAIGPWPGNPNIPSPQNFVCEFPRNPVQNTGTPRWTSLGPIGLWSNGVALYNPKDANYWKASTSSFAMGIDTSGTGWNRNALPYEGVSFDACLGHPDQSGCYHNHVHPKCLYNDADSTHHSPIIGYAFDGFPIYGAYGYAAATTPGGIKRMNSSFVLSTATSRLAGPPVNALYPLGNMCEDYVFTPGAGDLDIHNGRYCVTPDYPGGTYAYFVTIDANLNPVYPFVLGPTYYGIPGNVRPRVTPVGPDTTYTPANTAVGKIPNTTIKYQIAPNPVEENAYIYMDAANMNNVKVTLYSMDGKTLKIMEDLQPTIAYALNMSEFPAGMYLLSFEAGDVKVTEKIIKSK